MKQPTHPPTLDPKGPDSQAPGLRGLGSQSPQSFKRVLMKLSGEALAGNSPDSLHFPTINAFVSQIALLSERLEIALVVGGGNFFRGANGTKNVLMRGVADQMGTLATLMNGLVLQDCLRQQGIDAQLFSGLPIDGVSEPFIQAKRESYFGHRRVLIFAGGTGHPYFTTDTAAVVWGLRTGCQLVLKGTKVDGVYSADPVLHPDALFFERLSYAEVLQQKLGVMDLTALSLASENNLPLVVFNAQRSHGLIDVLDGKPPFTWID